MEKQDSCSQKVGEGYGGGGCNLFIIVVKGIQGFGNALILITNALDNSGATKNGTQI